MSNPPFELSFDTHPNVAAHGIDAPPLAFSLLGDGWGRLRIGEGSKALEIGLSNLYPPFFDLYAWALAIALDLGPVGLRIDEEGMGTRLYAARGDDGDEWKFAVLQFDAFDAPFDSLVWQEPRTGWLARLGQALNDFFADFDEAAWNPGPGQWPQAASVLDWRLPATLASKLPQPDGQWSLAQRRGWFALWLADLLGPWHGRWLDKEGCDVKKERHARYQFLFAQCMREACALAEQSLDLHIPARARKALAHVVDELSGLLEYCEMEREIGTWSGPEDLAETNARKQVLSHLGYALVRAADLLWRAHAKAAWPRLGLVEGRWLADPAREDGALPLQLWTKLDGLLSAPIPDNARR